MDRSGKYTISHDKIRAWVEERGGVPARVEGTGGASDPGILRIDFPQDGKDANLERISWDQWFEAFEQNELAFLYQDVPDSGFNKLVNRGDHEDELDEGDADDEAEDDAE